MITGTFTVETSTDPLLLVGASVPLSIDDSVVDVTVVTTSVVSVSAIPPDTASASTATPTDGEDTIDSGSNELAPGVPAADEPDNGPEAGEQLAPESTPPATA
jgi:hypothetical protein